MTVTRSTRGKKFDMAILDVLRRMTGRETTAEAAVAENAAKDELANRDYADPVKCFAANAAMALRGAPDEVLRRKLPDVTMIGDGRIPKEGARRQLHVARAAEVYGDRYATAGGDQGLDPALGEAVRMRTLMTVNMRDIADPESPTISVRIKARAAAAALATETYIGVGPMHERALNMAAMACEHSYNPKPLEPGRRAAAEEAIGPLDAERFGYMGPTRYEEAGSEVSIRRAVMAYEVAQARAGVLSPERIVRMADAADTGDMLRGIAQSPRPGETIEHVRPDFRNVGLDPRSPRYAEIVIGQFRETGRQIQDDRPARNTGTEIVHAPPEMKVVHAMRAIAHQKAGHGM